jgi:nucleoid DNA-binding protein
LNPKSHKDFKKGIAEKVGVHQDVVDDLLAFYFNKIRKNLSDLTYPYITLNGIGVFQLRKSKLVKAIKKNKDILGNLEKTTYEGFQKHIPVKEKLEHYNKVLIQLEELEAEKKQFKQKKYENKSDN